MPITATILSQSKTDLKITTHVEFSNGKQITFDANDSSAVIPTIANQAAQYEKIEAFVPVPEKTEVDLRPPDPPPGPTQEQIDANAFAVEFRKYRQTAAAVRENVGGLTQGDVDKQLDIVNAMWKPEYLEFFG